MSDENGVERHYERLLASVYAWSVSVAGDPFSRAHDCLTRAALLDGASYLDLGAGFGAHALVLARAGKTVTAVDTSAALLADLERTSHAEALRIETHRADLLEFLRGAAADRTWDVILCLGDTLTHLPSHDAVRTLFELIAAHLTPAGRAAISYRDSTNFSATGTARFIPVARDHTRTMHCFLEPIDEDRLRVTDIVTEVGPNGPETRLSDYVKLRLAPTWVRSAAEAAGLALVNDFEDRGMVTQIFAPAGASADTATPRP